MSKKTSNKLLKKKALDKYESQLKYMMSEKDFIPYLGIEAPNKIYTYEKLKQFNHIDDLLPETYDYAIIITQFEPHVGHWTCVVKYPDVYNQKPNRSTYCYFDSYGKPPDAELSLIPRFIKNLLFQSKNEITRLLNTASMQDDVVYNDFDFQSKKPTVCTCGRWVTGFIMAIKSGHTIQSFGEMILKKSELLDVPFDITICNIVPISYKSI